MLKNRTSIVFIFGMLLFSKCIFSQESCTHLVKTSDPSALISYLSEKYGAENTEQIVINIQEYEITNNVSVLCEAEFKNTILRLNAILVKTDDPEERNLLKDRIDRIILLNTIEEFLH